MQSIDIAPEQAPAYHALGLLETRAGNREQALSYLEKAAALEQAGIRHRYVYAIALHDYGRVEDALAQLKALLRDAPENPDILLALVTYSRGAGKIEDARRYAARLQALNPNDPRVRQLYNSL